jgi:zinc transport system permease protein
MPIMDIFQYDFMIRAFMAGILIGIVAPMIGIFLVVKRYSLLADTLSHVSLVGVAIGILFGFNPIVGALVTSTIAAFGMERLRETRKMFSESILALFLSGSFAIAVVLLGLSHGLTVDIFTYLFGSITTVSESDLWIIAIFGLVVIAVTGWLFKRLFLVSYDEELAKASGLPVTLLNIMLMLLAAVTVALSMRVVGILLVGALIVIPVLSAIQFGKSFMKTTLLALILSLTAVLTGLFASFYLNLPSGAAIVVVCLILFTLSLAYNRRNA